MIHASFHHGVDGFGGGHALEDAVGGFVDERHEHAIGDEARRIVDRDRLFAKLFGEAHGDGERGIAGLQGANYFDQRHHGNGIHEVHADEAVGSFSHGGQSSHGDGGGVAGDDGVFVEDGVGFQEHAALDIDFFGDRFDDELSGGDG